MTKKSEIYAQGYEKWEGDRARAVPNWYLIGMSSFGNLVSSSGCLARLVFNIGFIIYYSQLIIYSLIVFQMENLKRFELLRNFLEGLEAANIDLSPTNLHIRFILIQSIVFCILAMMFYGSQLISKDRRANALQVYFSKAVSHGDYILGKYFAVSLMTSLVSLVPSALILACGLIGTTDHLAFFRDAWYLPFLSVAYWLMLTIIFGSVTLYLSSCFDKSYMAGVSMLGFSIFCLVLSALFIKIFGASDILRGFNWVHSIWDIGKTIYRLEVESMSLQFWQVFDMALISAFSTFMLFRKVRPVEVVK